MPVDFTIFFAEAIASFSKLYAKATLEIEAPPQVVNIIGECFELKIRMGKLPDSSLVAKPLTSLIRYFSATLHSTPLWTTQRREIELGIAAVLAPPLPGIHPLPIKIIRCSGKCE